MSKKIRANQISENRPSLLFLDFVTIECRKAVIQPAYCRIGCSQPLYLAHKKEDASEASAKHAWGGGGG